MNDQNLVTQSDNEELIIANKRVTLTVTILCTIISLAYVLEVLKGARTWGYVLIVIALAYIPVIAGQIILKKDPSSERIK